MKSGTYQPYDYYKINEDYIVGTWSDGRLIYRKIIQTQVPGHTTSSNASKSYLIATDCSGIVDYKSLYYKQINSSFINFWKLPLFLQRNEVLCVSEELSMDTSNHHLTYYVYNTLTINTVDKAQRFSNNRLC